jgi:hypothetical protein
MSIAVNETDDMWWNGFEGVGVVRSECEEDEVADCEYRDSDTGESR